MQVQAVAEIKKRGCLTVLLYLILLCIPVVGWIALFMLLRGRKSVTTTYAVCQKCGYRMHPKNEVKPRYVESKVKPQEEPDKIKKLLFYPKKLNGHPLQYAYVLKLTPLVDLRQSVLCGEEKIVGVESSDTVINVIYNGEIVGTSDDAGKLKMLKDWEEKGFPRNGIILSDCEHLNIRFYADRRKNNSFREQTVTPLYCFQSEQAQGVIAVLENGDPLELEEINGKENAVIVSYESEKVGELPKKLADRFLEEGAYGAFFEKTDSVGDIEKPYVRIYW